jgi:diguanylate cyclase (GGDEF)-like protein
MVNDIRLGGQTVTEAGPSAGYTPARRRLALLVSEDFEAWRWGARWLDHLGFDVVASDERSHEPPQPASGDPTTVLLLDLRCARGRKLLDRMSADRADVAMPVLALCSRPQEIAAALERAVTDIARHPFDWRIVARRAARLATAVEAGEVLERLREQLTDIHRLAADAEARLQRNSRLDRLTGLPNRPAFEALLAEALPAAREAGHLAVLVVDLDRFRRVNDGFGKVGGDGVLRQVAERLCAHLHRPRLLSATTAGVVTSAVARLAGDRFGVLLSPVGGAEEVEEEARRLLESFAPPFALAGQEVYLSASVGLALSPGDGLAADHLLHNAELALGEVKAHGGGLIGFRRGDGDGQSHRSLEISRLLHGAVERGELEVWYQPFVDGDGGRVQAAEALLRWFSPELGEVPPLEFVPVAEESGLMGSLGRWVLASACRQLRSWLDAGVPRLRVAVNVSICQLIGGDLAADVEAVLRDTGIDPGLLELELSERGVLRNEPQILRQLEAVRRLGVRLSVDDFGTGNSAIGYLKQFPLDTLKIDRSYVGGVAGCADDAVIATATIAMAHGLRLRVVAEGVEHEAQRRFFVDRGCEELQGFLFARPMPASRLGALLLREPVDLRQDPDAGGTTTAGGGR